MKTICFDDGVEYDAHAIVQSSRIAYILTTKEDASLSPMTPFQVEAHTSGKIEYISPELKRRKLHKHGTRFNCENFYWINRAGNWSYKNNNHFMSSLKNEVPL